MTLEVLSVATIPCNILCCQPNREIYKFGCNRPAARGGCNNLDKNSPNLSILIQFVCKSNQEFMYSAQ